MGIANNRKLFPTKSRYYDNYEGGGTIVKCWCR